MMLFSHNGEKVYCLNDWICRGSYVYWESKPAGALNNDRPFSSSAVVTPHYN